MKYDLLLTGGDVLDPAGGLRGLMDIGIAGGKISAVAHSLPAADARRTISASQCRFSSSGAQQAKVRRPPGFSAPPMLRKAAVGLAKNMTPMREVARSKAAGSNSNTCASPSSNLTLCSPRCSTRWRATPSIGSEMSTATRRP